MLRAVGNLLSNAIKHSPPGAAVRLCARLAAEDSACVIEITDQGPGLSAEAMQRLNGAQQGGAQEGLVPVAARGVGFGLLFVQRVAQRHGGRLQVRAADHGRGAVFALEIGAGTGNP